MNSSTSIAVSGIYVYPVKGMAGIALQKANVLYKGLAFDRRWMLLDDNSKAITQRDLPQLALIQTKLHESELQLHFEGQNLVVPFTTNGEGLYGTVWDDTVLVNEVDAQISNQLSHWLQQRVRLVFFPEQNERAVDPDYAVGKNDTSLSDGYPILIAGDASLDDLNTRLNETVAMDRFRPNITVSGSLPFDEDHWQTFYCGSVKMHAVKPCARCVVTTINQQTGVAGTEPLKTLASFRRRGNKVLFGVNVIPVAEGMIHVGDCIQLV